MEQKTGAAGSAAGAATFRPSDTSESLSVANVQGFVTGIDASTKSQATTDSDEASVSVDASAKGSVDKDGVSVAVVGSVVASDFDGYTVTGLTFFDEEIIDYDTSTELEDEDSVLFTEGIDGSVSNTEVYAYADGADTADASATASTKAGGSASTKAGGSASSKAVGSRGFAGVAKDADAAVEIMTTGTVGNGRGIDQGLKIDVRFSGSSAKVKGFNQSTASGKTVVSPGGTSVEGEAFAESGYDEAKPKAEVTTNYDEAKAEVTTTTGGVFIASRPDEVQLDVNIAGNSGVAKANGYDKAHAKSKGTMDAQGASGEAYTKAEGVLPREIESSVLAFNAAILFDAGAPVGQDGYASSADEFGVEVSLAAAKAAGDSAEANAAGGVYNKNGEKDGFADASAVAVEAQSAVVAGGVALGTLEAKIVSGAFPDYEADGIIQGVGAVGRAEGTNFNGGGAYAHLDARGTDSDAYGSAYLDVGATSANGTGATAAGGLAGGGNGITNGNAAGADVSFVGAEGVLAAGTSVGQDEADLSLVAVSTPDDPVIPGGRLIGTGAFAEGFGEAGVGAAAVASIPDGTASAVGTAQSETQAQVGTQAVVSESGVAASAKARGDTDTDVFASAQINGASLLEDQSAVGGLCQKSNVVLPDMAAHRQLTTERIGNLCFPPSYKEDKGIGNLEYYGCPEDTFKCQVAPQALTLHAETTCTGGGFSSFLIDASLALSEYDSYGAPVYRATSVKFASVKDTEVYGFPVVEKIAICSVSRFFVPEELDGITVYYDWHRCATGAGGWVVSMPGFHSKFDSDETAGCSAKAAERGDLNFFSPPLGTTLWEAQAPFVCNGLATDQITHKKLPRGTASLTIKSVDLDAVKSATDKECTVGVRGNDEPLPLLAGTPQGMPLAGTPLADGAGSLGSLIGMNADALVDRRRALAAASGKNATTLKSEVLYAEDVFNRCASKR